MIEQIVAHMADIWLLVTTTVAIASGVAALTPTPTDDAILLKVRKILDVVALNVANAKNAK